MRGGAFFHQGNMSYLESLGVEPAASVQFPLRSADSKSWSRQSNRLYGTQTNMPIRHLRKEVSRPKPYYPRQYATFKENINSLNRMKRESEMQRNREMKSSPTHTLLKADKMTIPPRFPKRSPVQSVPSPMYHTPLTHTKHHYPPTHAQHHPPPTHAQHHPPPTHPNTHKDKAVPSQSDTDHHRLMSAAGAAARVAVAQCAKFNNSVDLGRYVTVMMDTSYKLASLAIFLYQNGTTPPSSTPKKVPLRTIV